MVKYLKQLLGFDFYLTVKTHFSFAQNARLLQGELLRTCPPQPLLPHLLNVSPYFIYSTEIPSLHTLLHTPQKLSLNNNSFNDMVSNINHMQQMIASPTVKAQ